MSERLLQMSGIVVDLLYDVDRVPTAGEEAIVSGFDIAPGGGYNALIAAKRAGLSVCYGGSIGTGPFAQIVLEKLKTEEIPVLKTQDLERDQGCCTVLLDKEGERTFIASDGAEGHVTSESLEQFGVSDYEWTLLSGYALHYCNSRGAIARWLREESSTTQLVFDPAPIVASLSQDDLRAALTRADWVSANLQEAVILTGHADPRTAARALAKNRAGGAIVRNGEAGCVIVSADICTEVPPFAVRAIDTNGAGDTHVGSFIAHLSQTGDPVSAAHFANTAAAISTTIRGPASAPTAKQMKGAFNSSTTMERKPPVARRIHR